MVVVYYVVVYYVVVVEHTTSEKLKKERRVCYTHFLLLFLLHMMHACSVVSSLCHMYVCPERLIVMILFFSTHVLNKSVC